MITTVGKFNDEERIFTYSIKVRNYDYAEISIKHMNYCIRILDDDVTEFNNRT